MGIWATQTISEVKIINGKPYPKTLWEKNKRYSDAEISKEDIEVGIRNGYFIKIKAYTPVRIIPQKPVRIILQKVRYSILQDQKWKCNNCGCQLKYSKNSTWDGVVAHIDHIHAFANAKDYTNGVMNINERSNLQALCPKCNIKKSKGIN